MRSILADLGDRRIRVQITPLQVCPAVRLIPRIRSIFGVLRTVSELHRYRGLGGEFFQVAAIPSRFGHAPLSSLALVMP